MMLSENNWLKINTTGMPFYLERKSLGFWCSAENFDFLDSLLKFSQIFRSDSDPECKPRAIIPGTVITIDSRV